MTLGLVLSARRHKLASPVALDMTPVSHWTEPEVVLEPEPHRPVLITIEYRVKSENHPAFRDAMMRLGRSRRRTGAERWSLYQDAADPDRFVENYLVGSWEEHMRQHYERQTAMDEAIQQRALALTENGASPPAQHLIFAYDG
jgi:quinol monooxygenase YgiN